MLIASHADFSRRYALPTAHNLAMLACLNGDGIMVSHPERPKEFWKRVRPSPLMATLAMNMCTAADKAASGGNSVNAVIKYKKAICYFEPSLCQYVDDTEMREWTEKQLDALRMQIQLLSH